MNTIIFVYYKFLPSILIAMFILCYLINVIYLYTSVIFTKSIEIIIRF